MNLQQMTMQKDMPHAPATITTVKQENNKKKYTNDYFINLV